MKHSFFMALFSAMVICCRGNSICGDMKAIDTLCKNAVLFAADTLYNNEVIFFGDTLIMDEPMHIKRQIEEIAAKDSMLSVDSCCFYVGDVGFDITVCDSYHLMLVSDTQVDDPSMEQVVNYLNSLYGTTDKSEPGNYWWSIEGLNDHSYERVCLRPIPLDSGGTRLWISVFH